MEAYILIFCSYFGMYLIGYSLGKLAGGEEVHKIHKEAEEKFK